MGQLVNFDRMACRGRFYWCISNALEQTIIVIRDGGHVVRVQVAWSCFVGFGCNALCRWAVHKLWT